MLISIAILAGVVVWALHQDAPSFPTSGGRLGALGAAIVLYFVACAVRGERWLVLLRENGADPPRADAYGLVVVGYMGNNILPARAGDVLRVVLLAPRAKTDRRTVIGTLVAERLCDVLVLGVLFVFLTYGVLSGATVDLSGRLRIVLGVLAVLAVAGVVAVVVLHRRGHLERVWAFVQPMIAATRNLKGRHGAEVLVLSVVVWALEGAVWWTTAYAADLGVDAIEALYLLALSSMLVLIPAGPGYAGTMEAAIILGTRALERSSSAALTYLLLLRFVLMVPVTLAGFVIAAARYHSGFGRLRALWRSDRASA